MTLNDLTELCLASPYNEVLGRGKPASGALAGLVEHHRVTAAGHDPVHGTRAHRTRFGESVVGAARCAATGLVEHRDMLAATLREAIGLTEDARG